MIGYYVHHHGRGHAQRAAQIAAALDEPVVALSSLELSGFADSVLLPRDDLDGSDDHDADGALHWAPLGSPGYAARMQLIAGWIATNRPRLMVVDVSVEVTVLCRTLGVPVAVVAGAGDRPDAPHTLAHRLASVVVAPWSEDVYRPDHLAAYAHKTRYVGAMSRFDACTPSPPGGLGTVLVLAGAGGGSIGPAEVEQARRATPQLTWTTCGLPGTPWRDDVWTALTTADVVVTHAGQNALAEVAAARRPAIVLPQDRPFGEQHATADALARHGLATVVPSWPTPAQWPGLIARAQGADGAAWSRWNSGDGAVRAARVLAGVQA